MAHAGPTSFDGQALGPHERSRSPIAVFFGAVHSGVLAFVQHLKSPPPATPERRVSPLDQGYLRAARAIGELSRLSWNISDQSRVRATEFLVALWRLDVRLPAPGVAPTPDGGVQLAWCVPTPQGKLEVEAILLAEGGEYSVGLAHDDGFIDEGGIDDLDQTVRHLAGYLKPHLG